MQMLTYEVALEIDSDIIEEFQNWWVAHIDDVLATKCFVSAEVFTEKFELLPKDDAKYRDPNGLNQPKTVVVHYKAKSEADLNEYFLQHASRLREPAVRKFNNKFRAKRRVLKLGLS